MLRVGSLAGGWLFFLGLHAQPPSLATLKAAVGSIEKDTSLAVTEVEGTIDEKSSVCHGVSFIYHYRQGSLVKMEESYGMSWGMASTEYFFQRDTLMLIRDIEDHFPWTPDSTGLDRTVLNRQFERSYYLWSFDLEIANERKGTPQWKEDACGHLEFDSSFRKLLEQEPR
jgi:hypothetical protein